MRKYKVNTANPNPKILTRYSLVSSLGSRSFGQKGLADCDSIGVNRLYSSIYMLKNDCEVTCQSG